MNKSKVLNIFLIAIPVVCFLAVSVSITLLWRHVGQLNIELRGVRSQLSAVDRSLAASIDLPTYQQVPTATQTAAEQAAFLDQLHAEAKSSGVQVITWLNQTSGSASPGTAAGQAHSLPAGINPITSQVEVVGSFHGLRQFLYHLQHTSRLLNLSVPRWMRGEWPVNHLTFTLTRYVTPEAAPIRASASRVANGPESATDVGAGR